MRVRGYHVRTKVVFFPTYYIAKNRSRQGTELKSTISFGKKRKISKNKHSPPHTCAFFTPKDAKLSELYGVPRQIVLE